MNSEFLLNRRKELGLSQNQVAEKLGYSTQLISLWESGKGYPNLSIWGDYASLLQVDLEGFLLDNVQRLNDKCDVNRFDSDKFANKIKRLRQDNNLTQIGLAKKLSINNKNISAWENGTSLPKINQFIKLCEIFNCSFDDLYFASDVITKPNKKKKKALIPIIVASSILVVAALVISTVVIIKNNQKTTNNIDDEIEEHYESNGDSHWKLDENGGVIELMPHDFVSSITKQPTCLEEGERTYTCKDCGYSKVEVVPATGHEHNGSWEHDEEYHYHVCIHDGEIFDKTLHTFDGLKTKNETCTEKGQITYTCTGCGYQIFEDVDPFGHTNDGVWHFSEEYHYHLCPTDNVMFDKELHSYDGGTLSSDGKSIIYKCTKCDKTKSVAVNDYIENGETLYFGSYPQTVINNESLLESLNGLSEVEDNGYYLYQGEYYYKQVSVVNYSTSASFNKFSNGNTISDNTDYWFKVEPILWKILEKTDDYYLLMSDMLLNTTAYGANNNYENSQIREWLNAVFYNMAFYNDNEYILTTEVDNYIEGNVNSCSNTFDKVFIPSKFDLTNLEYGFPTSTGTNAAHERISESTDYARINNLMIEANYHSRYCSRTPDEDRTNYIYSVQSDGHLPPDVISADIPFGVRPMIKISR